MSVGKVWVKLVGSDRDIHKVDITSAVDIDDLKKAIQADTTNTVDHVYHSADLIQCIPNATISSFHGVGSAENPFYYDLLPTTTAPVGIIAPITVERSGIVECINRMSEVKVEVSGEEYTILKCDDRFKLSERVSREFPDFVLIRQCTLDIMILIQLRMMRNVGRFLITGTPGVGKTVSIVVWLYMALKGELKTPCKHIIADLKTACIIINQTVPGRWVEQVYDRECILKHRFVDANDVLYLYDATYNKLPLILPYRSVVFSSPNLIHFKEFITIGIEQLAIYFTPLWKWDEVEALYLISTTVQDFASMLDVRRLFEIWGGLPRQILAAYEKGYKALNDSIQSCNAIACIQVLEKGSFLSYTEKDAVEVRSRLMHLDVVNDNTYERAMVNFGSPFIRDGLVRVSGRSFTNFYREFMNAHGHSEYAAKVRGNLYERLVLDKLRGISGDLSMSMEVISFTMKAGQPNTALSKITLPVMPYQAKEYAALEEINELGRVWIPHQSNFKSFDAIIAPLPPVDTALAQITVGESHPLHVGGAHECVERCKQLNTGYTIVFCLPPDVFDLWHKNNTVQNFVTQTGKKAEIHQYLNNLEQIVLCIPGDAVEEEKMNRMIQNLPTVS